MNNAHNQPEHDKDWLDKTTDFAKRHKLLVTVSALALAGAYYEFWFEPHTQVDKRDLESVAVSLPARENVKLDVLVAKMQERPTDYSGLYFVKSKSGHNTHVWLRGKNREIPDLYARTRHGNRAEQKQIMDTLEAALLRVRPQLRINGAWLLPGEHGFAPASGTEHKVVVDVVDDPSVQEELKTIHEALQKSVGASDLSTYSNYVMLALLAVTVGLPWLAGERFNRIFGFDGNGPAGRAGKMTKANTVLIEHPDKTLYDWEGDPNVKTEVEDIIAFLRNPKRINEIGGRIPRGILLVGPPGTGKTLLAKAIAGEAGVPFFTISGSDFVEMFVGVGAARVRDMFEQAKKNAPCIIFIDEIDAVGRHRGAGMGGGNDEREQTLNQLLVQMDGFDPRDGIVLLAATNRADVLDPALMRPGRFDQQINIPNPDRVQRYRLLRKVAKKMKMEPQAVEYLKVIATKTAGFSGAQLVDGLLNNAALRAGYRVNRAERRLQQQAAKIVAGVLQTLKEKLVEEKKNDKQIEKALAEARTGKEVVAALTAADLTDEQIAKRLPSELITVEDLDEGLWKVIAGLRSEREQTKESFEQTAYHELGHALSSEKDYQEGKGGKPIGEISCIMRARALGVTVTLTEGDQLSKTDIEILAEVRMAMAGRAAQWVISKRRDTGASNDFEQATNLLREYVMRFGFDHFVGPVHVGESGGSPFAGIQMARPQDRFVGTVLQNLIDRRMRAYSRQMMHEAEVLIANNVDEIKSMAAELLEAKAWTREDWLDALKRHGFDKKYGWKKLEYKAPDLTFAEEVDAEEAAKDPAFPASKWTLGWKQS